MSIFDGERDSFMQQMMLAQQQQQMYQSKLEQYAKQTKDRSPAKSPPPKAVTLTGGISDYLTYETTWTTATNADTIYVTSGEQQPKPPAKPRPETSLAWLDRRVNEMRVAL